MRNFRKIKSVTGGHVSETEQKAATIIKKGYTSKGKESPNSVQKRLCFDPKLGLTGCTENFHLVCSEIKKENQGLAQGIHA